MVFSFVVFVQTASKCFCHPIIKAFTVSSQSKLCCFYEQAPNASDTRQFYLFQQIFLLCSLKSNTSDFVQPLQPFLFCPTHTLLVFVLLVSSLMVCSLSRPREGGFDPERGEVGMRGLKECAAVVVQQTRVQRMPLPGGAEEKLWVKWWVLEFIIFSCLLLDRCDLELYYLC